MSDAVHIGFENLSDDRTPRQRELDINRTRYDNLSPSEFLASLHPENFDHFENALKLIEVIAATAMQKAMLGEEVTLTFNGQAIEIELLETGRYRVDGFYYSTKSSKELLRAIKLAMYHAIILSAFHAEIDGKLAIPYE